MISKTIKYWQYTFMHQERSTQKNRLIKSAADLKGLKMRGPTRPITQMLEKLGATPVGMPVPKVAPSLSKGVIDGMVVPWEIMPSFKLQELTKSHTDIVGSRGLYILTIFVYHE